MVLSHACWTSMSYSTTSFPPLSERRYVFGSPNVDKAVLNVRDGKFTIIAHNNSKENKYIQSIKLNGQPYNKAWIEFEDIAKGGTLEYEMGATPACWY